MRSNSFSLHDAAFVVDFWSQPAVFFASTGGLTSLDSGLREKFSPLHFLANLLRYWLGFHHFPPTVHRPLAMPNSLAWQSSPRRIWLAFPVEFGTGPRGRSLDPEIKLAYEKMNSGTSNTSPGNRTASWLNMARRNVEGFNDRWNNPSPHCTSGRGHRTGPLFRNALRRRPESKHQAFTGEEARCSTRAANCGGT